MKKLFIIHICLMAMACVMCSCERKNTTAVEHTTSKGTQYININGCRYYKVNLNGHDVYQYTFLTYVDEGSDIIHLEDMCEKCKNK